MLERPELWTGYMQFDCGLATCSSIVDWLHAVRLWTRYMQFDCGLAICSSIVDSLHAVRNEWGRKPHTRLEVCSLRKAIKICYMQSV
jgi:hypothetical protein